MTLIDALAEFPALFIGVSLLLGLLVGSFLNVVIYRVPLMLERDWREQCAELAGAASAGGGATGATNTREKFNLLVPRSACPHCKAPITAMQNIPILSYVLLGGKCASCAAPIPRRYPLVEALTGVLTAAVAWKFGFGWPALAAMVLTWYLIALTFIDVDHQLLPDNMTLPLLWLGVVLSLWGPAAEGGAIPVDLRSSVIGAVAGYSSLWLVYQTFRLVTGKEGMGYGDFKLFAALGAWLGYQMLLPIILVAAGVGAVCGIIILSRKKQGHETPIWFGPFLAAAGWIMLMFGNELVHGYLSLYPQH
ncbi:MAG: prepilin peptidase [Steroidobacteraceae bacterium]|nr:prepilin peptidase [Steroidobacteraceae bacterium]